MADPQPDKRFWRDYTSWDHCRSIVVHSVRGPARRASSSFPVAFALRGAINTAQKSPSGGVYLGYEASWSIPMALTPDGAALRPGDVVTEPDQGRVGGLLNWTVLTVGPDFVGGVWACKCIDLVMAHHLQDTIQVQRAGPNVDDAGATVKTWPPLGGRVLLECAGRVQPTGERPTTTQGRRAGLRTFDVFIDGDAYEIDSAEDTVYWQDRLGRDIVPRRLDIVDVVTPERLDDVYCLRCEERR